MNSFTIILLAALVGQQVADGYLTWRILQAGGRELNPVTRFLIDKMGLVAGLIAVKVVMLSLAILFLREQVVALALIVLLYMVVVVHNLRQLRRA